jgi:hypothetical protein
VQFNKAVGVYGTPQLLLATSPTQRAAAYVGGSSLNTLTFNYVVQSGDTAADLDYASTTALQLSGGLIKDLAGNNATLTLSSPGSAHSLGANKALVINGNLSNGQNVQMDPTYSFVQRMYLKALGRTSEASGYNYWYLKLVNSELTKTNLIKAFLSQPEYLNNFVTSVYHQYLHRDPDASGLNYWTTQMQHGLSEEDLIIQFLNSPEFLNQDNATFLRSLYQNFFGREPDELGNLYWINSLNNGLTKQQVIADFSSCYEFNALYVQAQFQQILGRSAESAAEHYYVQQLQQGMSRFNLTVILLDSVEFWNQTS